MKIRSKHTEISPICVATLIAICWGLSPASGNNATRSEHNGAPALDRSNLSIGGGTLFQTRFDKEHSSGDLISRPLGADGTFVQDTYDEDGNLTSFNGNWRALETVKAQSRRNGGSVTDQRHILTSGKNSSGTLTGRQFIWDHTNNGLTYDDGSGVEDLKSLVDPKAGVGTLSDPDYEDPVVNWTRGHDDNEGNNPTDFRRRTAVLGTIVHPSPQYVGAPFEHYPFDENAVFRRQMSMRTAMVYLPSNSGMLHGFRASDGFEVFAYIPHEILDDLSTISRQGYSEGLVFDATPTIADAYASFATCIDSPCWQSVLVGGLGEGGRTIYALNVTDPVTHAAVAESESEAPTNIFLWEYTNIDLGLTTARPIVKRLGDGTWSAIFGSGQGSANEDSALFVVDIADGSLIQQLNVDAGGHATGLSSPVAWDRDYDGDIDYVYAGDLNGSLWRFDFTNATKTGGVSVSFSGFPLVSVTDPGTGAGLPITTSPIVSVNPEGGLFIYFGTGMRVQEGAQHNGMFGVVDRGAALGTDPPLTVFSVEAVAPDQDEPSGLENRFRTATDESGTDEPMGWKLELPEGERILADPILNNERVSFTSTDADPQGSGGSWFISVDFKTGSAPGYPFLDLGGDGALDDSDRLDRSDDEDAPIPAIGHFLGTGPASGPTPANLIDGRDTVFIGIGDTQTVTRIPVARTRLGYGRISWREVLQ